MARTKKDKQAWVLFIVTFFVSLIVITYFIKSMSPDVDVEIGGSHNQVETDSDSDVKQAIDERLRWIQMEDNLPGVSKRDDESFDETNDEIKLKSDKKGVELAPIEYVKPETQKPKQINPPTPNIAPEPVAKSSQVVQPFKMAKVYVGSYATIEQAIQAQNNLMNATSSVSPFVKEINGVYVLQAGSYANVAKAEALAKEISALGFSVKVVKE